MDLAALFLCGVVLPYALAYVFFQSVEYEQLVAYSARSTMPAVQWLQSTFGDDWIWYASCIFAYGIMALTVQLVVVRRKKIHWRDLGLTTFRWKWIVAGTLIFAVVGTLESWMLSQVDFSDEPERNFYESFFPRNLNAVTVATLLLLAGPCAAFFEEIYYRGLLYRWLRQHANVAISASISSAFFAARHLYFWEPGGLYGWIGTGMIFLSGALFSLLFEWSRSLIPSILIHGTWNIVMFSLALSAY